MFFFLTVFIQQVWGCSPLRSGLAYLPYVPAILVATGLRTGRTAGTAAELLIVIITLIEEIRTQLRSPNWSAFTVEGMRAVGRA